MNHYLATFYTHLAALKTHRNLTKSGIEARMSPVPRKISSSCGTCVQYFAQTTCEELLDKDAETVYRLDGESVEILKEFE